MVDGRERPLTDHPHSVNRQSIHINYFQYLNLLNMSQTRLFQDFETVTYALLDKKTKHGPPRREESRLVVDGARARYVHSSSSMQPQSHAVVVMMVMNLSVAQHILDLAESQMRLSGPRVWQLGLSVR